MLDEKSRMEVLEAIHDKLSMRSAIGDPYVTLGDKTSDESITAFEARLDLCQLTLLYSKNPSEKAHTVQISPYFFGIPTTRTNVPNSLSNYRNLRVIYQGNSNGLQDILLQGVIISVCDNLPVVEESQPVCVKSHICTGELDLLSEEKEDFDALLTYCLMELGESN